jgi:hypothetical protein
MITNTQNLLWQVIAEKFAFGINKNVLPLLSFLDVSTYTKATILSHALYRTSWKSLERAWAIFIRPQAAWMCK